MTNSINATRPSKFIGRVSFVLMIVATLVTISSIDLLLPAVPLFPDIFSTSLGLAQLPVASYTLGAALGFLIFGTLGVYYNRARLLYGSFLLFAIVSLLCAFAENILTLSALRCLQGISSACAGVFAPALINTVFDDKKAMQAMSFMGSVQSLAPGFAPIAGIWLLEYYGWKSSFYLVACMALPVALTFAFMGKKLPIGQSTPTLKQGSYLRVLKELDFWRYGMSRALCLGGIVAFMLGLPTIFVNVMGLGMEDFVIVQACGIVVFFVTTNIAGHVGRYFNLERMMLLGLVVCCASAVAFCAYVLAGGTNFWAIWLNGVVMNIGFGTAGNILYFCSIKSAKGDDTRASAVAILWVLGAITFGVAVCAPFLSYGLVAVGAVAALMNMAGVAVFLLRKKQVSPI